MPSWSRSTRRSLMSLAPGRALEHRAGRSRPAARRREACDGGSPGRRCRASRGVPSGSFTDRGMRSASSFGRLVVNRSSGSTRCESPELAQIFMVVIPPSVGAGRLVRVGWSGQLLTGRKRGVDMMSLTCSNTISTWSPMRTASGSTVDDVDQHAARRRPGCRRARRHRTRTGRHRRDRGAAGGARR